MASDDVNDRAEEDDSWLSWPDSDAPSEPDPSGSPDPDDESAEEPAIGGRPAAAGGPDPSGAGDPPTSTGAVASAPSSDQLPAALTSLSAGKIDNVPAAIGALSMRIDSLLASTTTYRSVMTDRLAEYADLVARLNRTQAGDLEEFRKSNERTVTELRRSLTASEEALRSVTTNSEQLVTDVSSLTEQVRSSAADSREFLDSVDKLGRFVTEALDQFAERVLGELRQITEALAPDLSTVRAEVGLLRESLDDLNERATNRPVREAVDELRSDISGLRRAVLEWPDLEAVRDDVVSLRADVADLLAVNGLSDSDGSSALTTALDEIRALRRDLAAIMEDDGNAELAKVIHDFSALEQAIQKLPDRAEFVAQLTDLRADLEGAGAADSGTRAFGDVADELAEVQSRLAELPTLADVRDELAGIQGGLEIPSPETLGADLAELRADLTALRTTISESTAGGDPALARAMQSDLGELRGNVDDLTKAVAVLLDRDPAAGAAPDAGAMGETLDEIAKELKVLRRRVKVRAKDEPFELSENQLAELVTRLAAELSDGK